MANVLHHHDTHSLEVPSRVYWTAAIGLVLLAMLVIFSTTTASDPAATATYLNEQPVLKFTPFVPML